MGLNKVILYAIYFELIYDSRFSKVPNNFWKGRSNQLTALKELEEKLGIKELEDWYKVKIQDLPDNRLLKSCNYSLLELLKTFFPDYDWKPWKFLYSNRGAWKSAQNAREYLESVTTKNENPTEYVTQLYINYQDWARSRNASFSFQEVILFF